MPYEASLNRRQLEIALRDISNRLREAQRASVPVGLREYAIAAAIFLAHAELENYFVDVLGRLATMYASKVPNAATLPPRLRAHLIAVKLNLQALAEKIVSRSGEPDILASVEGWFTSPVSALLSGSTALMPFDGNAIHGEFGYPSSKNIIRVLRRIGIGDPKGSLNAAVKRDAFALLESLSALRTALAHTATLPGIGPQDVRNRLDGLKVFVRSMDRVLYSHSRTFVSHDVWKGSMC